MLSKSSTSTLIDQPTLLLSGTHGVKTLTSGASPLCSSGPPAVGPALHSPFPNIWISEPTITWEPLEQQREQLQGQHPGPLPALGRKAGEEWTLWTDDHMRTLRSLQVGDQT